MCLMDSLKVQVKLEAMVPSFKYYNKTIEHLLTYYNNTMNYKPINLSNQPGPFGYQNIALFGIAILLKFVDVFRDDVHKSLFVKKIHGLEKSPSNKYTLIIVFISAIIFVTVISIYDVVRNIINYYYAKKVLTDKTINNDPKSITNTMTVNKNTLISSIIFSSFCIISGVN